MYGLGFSRAIASRAMTSYRFSSVSYQPYKAPAFRPMSSLTLQPVAVSRLCNLAYTWDHFLLEELSGEIENTDDEILSVTKNMEGSRWGSN